MKVFKGICFFLLWYSCIVWAVYYIYCPLVFLLLINRRWFRKLTDIILSCWELYPAALLEIMMGCRVVISGDDINPDDSAILMMNHRNRLDWFFLWACLVHSSKPPAHRCKFILKSDVRLIPGIGWGLQLAGYLFIHRNWEKDKSLLKRSVEYFKALGNKYQILIFPEGTDFTEESKAKSDSFAKKNGLVRYEHVLHPRTTGFGYLVDCMKKGSQLDAVYDITVGYPRTIPTGETDLLLGRVPEEVHFHIKRYNSTEVPSDESDIKSWCEKRWSEKESTLDAFYKPEKDKRSFSPDAKCDRIWNALYFALVGWTLFTGLLIYITFTTTIGFYWVVTCTVFFVIVSLSSIGIQQFEIDLFNRFDTNKSSGKLEATDAASMKTNSTHDKYKAAPENTLNNHLKVSFSSSDSIPNNERDKKVS